MFKAINKEIKEEILHKIKSDGLSVADAAEEYGISAKTIYGWLGRENSSAPSILEINKLKRKNRELYTMIGMLTTEIEHLKKGRR